MPWKIVYDETQNIAVLVGVEPPVALGPIAEGSEGVDPRDVIYEFVAALDREPDQWPTWALFSEWDNYVRAIVQLSEDALEEAQQGAQDDEQGAGGETGTLEPAAPQAGQEIALGDAAAADDDPDPDGNGDAAAWVRAMEAGQPAAVPVSVADEECWLCRGSGRLEAPGGHIDCTICGGRGRVEIGLSAP